MLKVCILKQSKYAMMILQDTAGCLNHKSYKLELSKYILTTI